MDFVGSPANTECHPVPTYKYLCVCACVFLRGVKWSTNRPGHRKQELFIRPVRSASSPVPVARRTTRERDTLRRNNSIIVLFRVPPSLPLPFWNFYGLSPRFVFFSTLFISARVPPLPRNFLVGFDRFSRPNHKRPPSAPFRASVSSPSHSSADPEF